MAVCIDSHAVHCVDETGLVLLGGFIIDLKRADVQKLVVITNRCVGLITGQRLKNSAVGRLVGSCVSTNQP